MDNNFGTSGISPGQISWKSIIILYDTHILKLLKIEHYIKLRKGPWSQIDGYSSTTALFWPYSFFLFFSKMAI